VFKNISVLYIAQLLKLILPLITIPYLARILGVNGWGVISYLQSMGMVFAILVIYGFDISATREIAKFKNQPDKLREIVCGILSARIILAVIFFILILFFRPFFPIISQNVILFILVIIWAFFFSMNMFWFFQGTEQMVLLAKIDIFSKIISIILIFILINKPGDEWKYFLSHSIGLCLAVIISLITIYKEVGYESPKYQLGKKYILNGRDIFLSSAAWNLYNSGSAFLLGLFVSIEGVGYFASADRIIKLFREILRPFNQVLFPRVINLINIKNINMAKSYLLKSAIFLNIFALLTSCCFYFFANYVIIAIYGVKFIDSIIILKIFSIIPIIIVNTNIFGNLWLIPLGLDRQYLYIIICALILNVTLIVVFVPNFGIVGMALITVLTEMLILSAFITYNFYRIK